MKAKERKYQALSVAGVSMLLIAAALFDRWQEALKKSVGETFNFELAEVSFWALPITALLIAILTQALYHFAEKHTKKFTSSLFLVVGLIFLFYPTVYVTFKLSSPPIPRPTYFTNSIFFYTSAWIAASGLYGMINLKNG